MMRCRKGPTTVTQVVLGRRLVSVAPSGSAATMARRRRSPSERRSYRQERLRSGPLHRTGGTISCRALPSETPHHLASLRAVRLLRRQPTGEFCAHAGLQDGDALDWGLYSQAVHRCLCATLRGDGYTYGGATSPCCGANTAPARDASCRCRRANSADDGGRYGRWIGKHTVVCASTLERCLPCMSLSALALRPHDLAAQRSLERR